MGDKSRNSEFKQPDTNLAPVQRPPAPNADRPPDIKPSSTNDVYFAAELPFPVSLENIWSGRIERTRSSMVPIPQDPVGRARVRAEILMRLTEFVTSHKGHALSHSRHTGDRDSLRASCETCQETMTVIFEY